jgi:hypothetical protein
MRNSRLATCTACKRISLIVSYLRLFLSFRFRLINLLLELSL